MKPFTKDTRTPEPRGVQFFSDLLYFIVGAIIAIACTLLAAHAIYDDVTGVYHMIKNLL